MKNIFKPLLFTLVIVLLSASYYGCGKSDSPVTELPDKRISLVDEIDLPFNEPSGIAWSEQLRKLWVVSGGDQKIYRLDTSGNVEKHLRYTGIDLEGIVFDPADSTLWTIDEATKEVAHLNLQGDVIGSFTVTYETDTNKGPEGIAIGKDHEFYILNERDPSVLHRLDEQWHIAQTYQLDFASDYSDITWDSAAGSFLILSDESKAFYRWNVQLGVIATYDLPNASNEGIAYDRSRGIIYIVNDAKAKLYIYKLL